MLIDPRCDLRLFIEGFSCSIMSASISTAVKLTATIEVLPTKEVRQLKPMTNIVVGFRDVSGKKAALTDEQGVTYSVLFVGMLTGIALTKSGTARSASLNCSGHHTLLERHYTYVSNIATQAFSQKKNFVGAAGFFRTEQGRSGLSAQVAAVFKDETPPFTPGLSELTGPPKGAMKLIEKCIGVTLPAGSTKEGKAHGAQHEFFAHASHQCRLLFQIDGVSTDEGLNKLLNKDNAGATIGNAASQMSDHTDLATMLDILLKHMYYSFLPMGAPRTYISSDKELIQRNNVMSDLNQKYVPDVVSAGAVPSAISANGSALVDFAAGSAAGYANIPDGANKDEVAKKKFTDFIKTPAGAKKILPSLSTEITNLVPEDRRSGLLERVAPFIFDGVKLFHLGLVNPKITEQDAATLNQIIPFLLRSIALSAKVDKNATGTSFARVVSYNMIPDLTFCTPPTCNVIFPNQVSTFNYTKNSFYLPTRLLLHGALVSNAQEQQGGVAGYYAPSTSAFQNQGAVAKQDVDIPLLNHEKFTGVVPSFASISFFEKFKSVDLSDNTAMMLRIANFNLMLKRYESTAISCTGPFNPFVAVGFPIAFIDVDDVTAESPTMYVGLLASCSHTYSGAGSASTTYTVKCVREVGEVDEIFGDAILRSTNSASASAVLLSYTDTDTGPNFINEAFTAALQPLANLPAFLASYLLGSDLEVTVNGDKKKFRELFIRPPVLQVLQKNLPPELAGSQLSAADWVGTNAFAPKTVLSMLKSPSRAKDVMDHIAKEPVINNVASCAKHAADILDTKFIAPPDDTILEDFTFTGAQLIKRKVSELRAIEKDPKFNAAFSVDLLNQVQHGRSLLQHISEEIIAVLADGVHRTSSPFRLEGPQTLTWLALFPLDIVRILADVKAGNPTSYFGGGISFLSSVTREVSVYPQASAPSADAPATAAEKVAVEELYRPPWFSNIFSIATIGDAVYRRALGCGSVQDVVPTSVPKDTSVNATGGSLLTHTTRLSLFHAYQGYRKAPIYSKGEFVNAFVRRPIANVLDVLGPGGLLTTPIVDACVVDLGAICNKSKVRNLAAVDTTSKSLTFAPNELVSEKRSSAVAYISSVKGDAFR